MRPWVTLLLVATTVCGCATAIRQGGTPKLATQPSAGIHMIVTRVGVEPKQFNPTNGEQAIIRFTLEQPATVTLRIYDEEDGLVKVIRAAGRQAAGAHSMSWDGRDEAGTVIPDGVYVYTLSALDDANRLSLFDPADDTAGERIKPEGGEIDRARHVIGYELPRAARVRIRIGIPDGGPHLRTLVDWQPRQAGHHEEPWDGLDASGTMNLLEHPKTNIGIRAFSLPDNSIIAEGQPTAASVHDAEGANRERRAHRHPSAGTYLHALHPRAMCREPQLTVELPEKVHGRIPIRIRLAPRDRASVLQRRYEVVLFIDTNFFLEEEEGYDPFTYLFDPSTISKGDHLLTVNLLSFDDHVGVVTIPLVVE